MINKYLKGLTEVIEDVVFNVIDVFKKTAAVFLVVIYFLILGISGLMTLAGWYFTGIESSLIGLCVFCVCIAILLHIVEKK